MAISRRTKAARHDAGRARRVDLPVRRHVGVRDLLRDLHVSACPGARAFDESRHTLSIGIGLTNTLILLTSSLFVVTAVRAIRTSSAGPRDDCSLVRSSAVWRSSVSRRSSTPRKVHEGHVPDQNNFYMYYFILTGLHLFHVLIGLVVLILLLTQARQTELSPMRMALVEGEPASGTWSTCCGSSCSRCSIW